MQLFVDFDERNEINVVCKLFHKVFLIFYYCFYGTLYDNNDNNVNIKFLMVINNATRR